MKEKNQGKTEAQKEFSLFMFSGAILGIIVLGLIYLIKVGFGF
jgi:hypothetical protein